MELSASRLHRLVDHLVRRKWWWFWAWWLHVCLIHYFILGFISGDGYGYRGVPLVELVQHGSLGAGKYNDWAQVGYIPFVELANVPFLTLFGLQGFIIGFPLLVFPLCAVAIYKLLVEITGDKRSGLFGAFAYCAMPMINQQPFSGYVDFAVAGILAYFLYAVLRLRHESGRLALVRLVIASCMLGLARSQGVYIAIFMFPFLVYVAFCRRDGWRIRIESRRNLVRVAAAMLIGLLPAIALQIYKYLVYGSPIAPMQFQFLGIEIGTGVPMSHYFIYAGLGGDGLSSLMKGFFEGWVWHGAWPIGAFYGSQFMGAGLMFNLAVVMVPLVIRRATRLERWLLVIFILISILARDFAVPRWSYTTMLGIVLIVGRAMPLLLDHRSRWLRAAFAGAFVIMGLHLLRPELDLKQLRAGYVGHRMNVASSRYYIRGFDTIRIYPSSGYRFVIIDYVDLTLPIFGHRLSNEVVGTIDSTRLGAGCQALASYLDQDPSILFIDQRDKTKDCRRTCAIPWGSDDCAGWKIEPL
jgi:hypothetical protein